MYFIYCVVINVVAELLVLLLHVVVVLCLNLGTETQHVAGVFHTLNLFL